MQRALWEKDVAKGLGIRQRMLAEIRLKHLTRGEDWTTINETGTIEYTLPGARKLCALLKLDPSVLDEKKTGEDSHVAGAGVPDSCGGSGKGSSPVFRSLLIVRIKVPNKNNVLAWLVGGTTAQRVRVKDKTKLRLKEWVKCRHVEADLWEMVGKGEPDERASEGVLPGAREAARKEGRGEVSAEGSGAGEKGES